MYPKVNHRLLFDLKADPHEQRNLAESPEQAGQVGRMLELMESWRIRMGDKDPLEVEHPVAKIPVYKNETRTLDRWQPAWIREKYFEGRDDPNHGVAKPKKKKAE